MVTVWLGFRRERVKRLSDTELVIRGLDFTGSRVSGEGRFKLAAGTAWNWATTPAKKQIENLYCMGTPPLRDNKMPELFSAG
jgi:hypothetical protein